jgi:tRNA-specific 2-thiouridylase
MSGGVDSSVCAYLLKEAGYDVTGAYIRVFGEEGSDGARAAAVFFGIPLVVLDWRERFKRFVTDDFKGEYLSGRTPNPCTVCNRYVKWAALIELADKVGAEYAATGHYAAIAEYKTGRLAVREAADRGKDQGYYLYGLTQEQLSRALTPLAAYKKAEIREIARGLGLASAAAPDSQEICFIPKGHYSGFVLDGKEAQKGNFVDEDGKVIGTHAGITNFTVGQRKGLGMAFGAPTFVKRIDAANNEVVLCAEEGLYAKTVYVRDVNYMGLERIEGRLRVKAKLRYAHKAADCVVFMEDGLIRCEFNEPQRAATPGQAAVFYDEGFVVFGGIIV